MLHGSLAEVAVKQRHGQFERVDQRSVERRGSRPVEGGQERLERAKRALARLSDAVRVETIGAAEFDHLQHVVAPIGPFADGPWILVAETVADGVEVARVPLENDSRGRAQKVERRRPRARRPDPASARDRKRAPRRSAHKPNSTVPKRAPSSRAAALARPAENRRARARSMISAAALTVNVVATICSGSREFHLAGDVLDDARRLARAGRGDDRRDAGKWIHRCASPPIRHRLVRSQ